MPAHSPSYEFSSQPRPVKTRSKFRQEFGDSEKPQPQQDQFLPVNIHHDPRVARGNTFAWERHEDVPVTAARSKTETKAKGVFRHGRSRGSSSSLFESNSSQSFVREDLDLSRYLVEPGEGAVRPEQEVDTQTDAFEERPQTPDFVPKKTGVDASTQIEASDKLFDLQAEIQPLLDVLVGKTLEQARIEVEREHELECIRQTADTLKRQRADEALRVSQLKQAAILAEREKDELRRRRRAEAEERRIAKEKVACLQLMRQVLPLSLDNAFEALSRKSWTTPTAHQVNHVFLPWLFERVAAGVDQRSSVRATLDGLLVSVGETAEAAKLERADARRRETEALEQASRAARKRTINLFVPAELVGGEEGERVGPITVPAVETVSAAEMRVVRWLEKEGKIDEVSAPDGGFLAGYLREARRRGGGGAGGRLGKTSTLLELQERMGDSGGEVLLRVALES